MTTPEASLATPQAVMRELFEANEAVKAQFQNALSSELLEFAEALAPSMARFEKFTKSCEATVQVGLVGAFVHGVLDDLLTSVKLLLLGMMNPSGNSFRQAMEGICMAVMCAHDGPLQISGKELAYWRLVERDSFLSQGHLAVRFFRENADRLGLHGQGSALLEQTLKAHHAPSHAGRLAIAHRMDIAPGGQIWFGGHFDRHKEEGYRSALHQQRNGARWAGELLDVLWPKVKALSEAAAAAPPAAN